MLTEVSPILFAVRVNGVVVVSNISSRTLAEAHVLQLPPDQRLVAEIVPITADGKTILFG